MSLGFSTRTGCTCLASTAPHLHFAFAPATLWPRLPAASLFPLPTPAQFSVLRTPIKSNSPLVTALHSCQLPNHNHM